jgi:hypothetical protein
MIDDYPSGGWSNEASRQPKPSHAFGPAAAIRMGADLVMRHRLTGDLQGYRTAAGAGGCRSLIPANRPPGIRRRG